MPPIKLRFTPKNPCPICAGYDPIPCGESKRCYGFMSADRVWAHCTREEYAGRLTQNTESGTHLHRLNRKCACGIEHGVSGLGARGSGEDRNGRHRPSRELIAAYDYCDGTGELRY